MAALTLFQLYALQKRLNWEKNKSSYFKAATVD